MDDDDEGGILRYYNPHVLQVVVGHTFRINGSIPEYGNLFTIDFITNLVEDIYRDIALRLTGRVQNNALTRSYRRADEWSTEEVVSASKPKLSADKSITIEVLTSDSEFLIALNGIHYAYFAHRFPYSKIRIIEIRGDLVNIQVDQKMAIEYPFRPANSPHYGIIYDVNTGVAASSMIKKDGHLPLPYVATFDSAFLTECSTLTIIGVIIDGAKDFSVTLQTGPQYWPAPSICYDVKFYLFNETSGEVPPRKTPNSEIVNVEYGETIKLHLIREEQGFYAFLNKQQFPLRPFQIDPSCVNAIVVSGDLKLIDIIIET